MSADDTRSIVPKRARWGGLGGRRRVPGTLNLALQGGGAHGAFTWGVLDHLLEYGLERLEGLSGTSAGALNAVALASGWLEGGPERARETLAALWRGIADLARLSPWRAGGLTQMAADFAAQLLSPYQLNPLGLNPLRSVLEQVVDFERLRAAAQLEVFVATTNLLDGRGRIFRRSELSSEVVLASACLPQLHQALEIDGAAYWDGGFVSNPPLLPLVEHCRCRDLLLVRINALEATALPRTAREIRNRLTEIVFGRPLLVELDQLAEAARRARPPLGWLRRRTRRLARHRLHVIDGAPALARLDLNSKVDPDWAMLVRLHELGREAAAIWRAAPLGPEPADVDGTARLPSVPQAG